MNQTEKAVKFRVLHSQDDVVLFQISQMLKNSAKLDE